MSLDGLRWGDLFRIVDRARQAEVPAHQDVDVVVTDNGAIALALPEPLDPWFADRACRAVPARHPVLLM